MIPNIFFPTLFFGILCLVVGLAVCVLRTVQLFNGIDFSSGFYNGPSWTVILLNVLLALSFVVLLVIGFLDQNRYTALFSRRSYVLLSIFSILMGIGFVYRSTTNLLDWIIGVNSCDPLSFIVWVLQLASGFLMFRMAVVRHTPNQGAKDLLHLIPCLWACLTVVKMFLTHTVVITVSENLYNLLRMVAVLLFFLACAKYYAGYTGKNVSRWIAVFGCMTVILSAVTTIPLLIAHFFGHGYTVDHVIESSITDLILMMYVAVFTFTFLHSRRKQTVAFVSDSEMEYASEDLTSDNM